MFRDGRNEDAVAIFSKILEKRPDIAPAHNFLGMARANQGKMDDALACYRRALEIDPDLADAHNNLGNLLRHLGDHQEAIASYQRVLDLVPGSTVIHVNMGKTLAAMGRGEEAAACFDRALEMDGKSAPALRGLARLQEQEGDGEGAIATFRRALEIEPNSVAGLNDLGILLESQQHLDEALACFQRALEIDPKAVGSRVNLSNILRSQEKLEEAEAALLRALEIDPLSTSAHNNLGIIYRDMQREEDAIACFRRTLEINPNHIEALNNMGNALRRLGKDEEALAAFQRAIDIDPDFMEVYLNRAKVYKFHDGDPELERLKGYMEKEDLSEHYRKHLFFTLGKAHDDAGLYGEAFSNFQKGNEMMARQEPYDARNHRIGVEVLKRIFHRALPPAREEPAAADRIPIFIVGMSRSGKTITESLLARHPDVYDAGERKEWTKAIQEVCDRYSITEGFPQCMDAMNGDRIREIGQVYIDMVGKTDPDSKYIINTIPGNYSHVGLIFLAFPHVRVIYCHRYPLDNFLQVYFYRYKHGNQHSYRFGDLISYYADYLNIMRHWFGLYGGRMLSVEYEATIRNPAETAKRVYDYCGLEFDPRSIMDMEFRSDEIGHWKNYEPYLGEVREALLRMIQEEKRVKAVS